MKLLDDLKGLLTGARTAIQKLRSAEQALREKIAALQQERTQLLSLPAAPEEIRANIERLVADMRAAWVAAHGTGAVHRLGGRLSVDFGPGSETLMPPALPEPLGGVLTVEALAVLAPQLVVDGLAGVVGAVEYQPGPTMSARLARVTALDGEIGVAERELAALADAARAEGIGGIPLPDGERARRLQAERRHGVWQTDEALTKAARHGLPHSPLPEPEE